MLKDDEKKLIVMLLKNTTWSTNEAELVILAKNIMIKLEKDLNGSASEIEG